jgi:serine phosphatase RsbU (regulator of sigma subunit)
MRLYRFSAGIAPFARGDLLVLFTDGVVERRGIGIDVGLERLRDVVEGAAGLALDELLDTVVAAMPQGTADDRALLALRRTA